MVPLLGESSFTGSYTQMNQIVLQMARAFSGQPYFLLAPLVVGSRTLRDDLLADETAKPVADRWNRLTVACVGIGALPPVHGQVVYLGEGNVGEYIASGAVGDIVARHFTLQGNQIRTSLDDRILGISLEQLRTAQTIIAVAGGIEKTQAVLGALRTNLITDLFLDQELAQAVLGEHVKISDALFSPRIRRQHRLAVALHHDLGEAALDDGRIVVPGGNVIAGNEDEHVVARVDHPVGLHGRDVGDRPRLPGHSLKIAGARLQQQIALARAHRSRSPADPAARGSAPWSCGTRHPLCPGKMRVTPKDISEVLVTKG